MSPVTVSSSPPGSSWSMAMVSPSSPAEGGSACSTSEAIPGSVLPGKRVAIALTGDDGRTDTTFFISVPKSEEEDAACVSLGFRAALAARTLGFFSRAAYGVWEEDNGEKGQVWGAARGLISGRHEIRVAVATLDGTKPVADTKVKGLCVPRALTDATSLGGTISSTRCGRLAPLRPNSSL